MRLGQLSRKLGVSPAEIIHFLSSKQIAISEDSNSKIENLHAHWVTEQFAPHLITSVKEILSEEIKDTILPIKTSFVAEAPIVEVTNEEPAIPEVIKATKIELAGLKVLGKIEIPEKKKKTEEKSNELGEEEKERKSLNERSRSTTRAFQDRPHKNLIAVQRKREQREAEQRKKELLAKEKEKKTNHYFNRVKRTTSAKKIKKWEHPAEVVDTSVEKVPTTLWGKFMRWLNT